MKPLLQASAAAALISVTVFALTLTVAVEHIQPQVLMTLRGLHASANETALTMRNLRDATAEWKEASKRSTEVELQAKADLVKFGAFVDHTDFELNSQVLPGLRGAIAANSDQLVGLEKTSAETLQQFSRDSSATLAQSKSLLDQLNQDASDPAIHSTLEHVDATTANIAGTSKDLKDVADKFRNDYLKPQKFAWELLKQLAGMGGSVAQMVK